MSANNQDCFASLSIVQLDTVTGGGIVDNITGAPGRFLNGWAYGTKVIGPSNEMGPVTTKLAGVVNGGYAVFNPKSDVDRIGGDIRAGRGFGFDNPRPAQP